MKRKLLLSILAMVSAAFMPLAATSQLIHDREAQPAEKAAPTKKYEVFAGYGYTSLNQVNQSRYGLEGPNVSVTRDWGRFFGITADGAVYQYSFSTPNVQYTKVITPTPPPPASPTVLVDLSPTVDSFLIGPVLHANLFRRYDAFFHVLLGVEHTGGVNASPNISFAGGVGVGVDYKLTPRFSLRASGDDIASSFVAPVEPGYTCTTTSNCTAHERRNSRAAFGLVYKF
ncbi:MAG: hypothetical protein ABSD72_08920 [Terracidiphilus sp.]